MAIQSTYASTESANSSTGNSSSAPQLSLPKGGGSIRGIGEKFTANPVTGTGSLTVPIAKYGNTGPLVTQDASQLSWFFEIALTTAKGISRPRPQTPTGAFLFRPR